MNREAVAARVVLMPQAADFLSTATPEVRSHLVNLIREKANDAHLQMVVVSWTRDGSWPHIERCAKSYRFKPGIRILFHLTRNPDGICVDKIAWRDCDPYEDSH